MKYESIKDLSDSHFKRTTGVTKAVFSIMLETVETYKRNRRKHVSRGRPPKVSFADKILLLLMYYREYRTQFHISLAYGISESRVCEIIREIEDILLQDKRFHLQGKKALLKPDKQIEAVLIDVTESPIERPQKNSVGIILVRRSVTH